MTGLFITRTDTKVAGAILPFRRVPPFFFPDGFDTNYQYDTLGNLVTVIPSRGNSTSIVYDSLSRKTQMTDPAMGTWHYYYDNGGNLVQQTDAKGQTTKFHYDALNRLEIKEYVGYQNGAYDVSYAYDDDGTASPYAIGKLTRVIDHSGTTQFYYDMLGRKAWET